MFTAEENIATPQSVVIDTVLAQKMFQVSAPWASGSSFARNGPSPIRTR